MTIFTENTSIRAFIKLKHNVMVNAPSALKRSLQRQSDNVTSVFSSAQKQYVAKSRLPIDHRSASIPWLIERLRGICYVSTALINSISVLGSKPFLLKLVFSRRQTKRTKRWLKTSGRITSVIIGFHLF